MEFGPLIVGLVSTFFLAAGLLWRYGQPGNHHVAVTASVFLAWYFSTLIIVLMPLDVSSVSSILDYIHTEMVILRIKGTTKGKIILIRSDLKALIIAKYQFHNQFVLHYNLINLLFSVKM